MQLNISGHHISVTPATRKHIETKLERLERHSENITNVHVIISVNKSEHHAEATVHIGGSKELFADSKATNLYIAIDHLIDKLDRQVLKFKEKSTSHRPN